jgi:hypothetical protein
MNLPSFDFVQATDVRRAVVPAGDIRGDIAFQNDINVLLARLDGISPPLQALGWVREAVGAPGRASHADAPSHVVPDPRVRSWQAESSLPVLLSRVA